MYFLFNRVLSFYLLMCCRWFLSTVLETLFSPKGLWVFCKILHAAVIFFLGMHRSYGMVTELILFPFMSPLLQPDSPRSTTFPLGFPTYITYQEFLPFLFISNNSNPSNFLNCNSILFPGKPDLAQMLIL